MWQSKVLQGLSHLMLVYFLVSLFLSFMYTAADKTNTAVVKNKKVATIWVNSADINEHANSP